MANAQAMTIEEANHEKFLSHLDASQSAVFAIAAWLHRKGYPVKINTTGRATNRKEARSYADPGDLEICHRIEVKHSGSKFTCAADWPHREKFIVCAKHAWDNATPKPFAFFILNDKETHVAMVKCGSSAQWTVEKRRDSRYQGVVQDYYFAPMSAVEFINLDPHAVSQETH